MPIPGGKRHIAEGAVAIVMIEVAGVVGEVGLENIEPAVAVVIEKRQTTAFRFDDVLFMVGRTPNIQVRQSGFSSDINEMRIERAPRGNRFRFGLHTRGATPWPNEGLAQAARIREQTGGVRPS